MRITIPTSSVFTAKMQRMMAYRSFTVAGITAAAGSDFSRPFAPLMGIQGMVTRTGWNGETWGADQRISVDQALRVNTTIGAYASHEEAIKGSITSENWRTSSSWQTILTRWTRARSRTSRSYGP
jgi:predicted amidohydrolase YtcJ